ncbi:MAG: phosphatase domain-containing protein [Myxococcota bacterium]|nr:phosphatase domain-containing protein [Myxococcota bacterium]
MEVYRWDLDKTYLATDFDSVRGLVRSALESPHAKRNVPGSGALLRALSARPHTKVVILSGSPTQMRATLSEKLRLDGIRYDELHLKDNLNNLRRGRFRAVKGQFGYKLPALLTGRMGMGPEHSETLFGDDAEVDALVYSVFADAIAGRLTPAEVQRIMEAGKAYPDRIQTALDALEQVERHDAVERIFIRIERGIPPRIFRNLGARLVPVYSWFQAALVLYGAERLSAKQVQSVALEVIAAGQGDLALGNLFQDIVRRGHVPLSRMATLVDELQDARLAELIARCRKRVRWLGDEDSRYRPPAPPSSVDYLRLLHHFHK